MAVTKAQWNVAVYSQPSGEDAMPSCFVIMGYGKKTDFKQNKSFDLDKTYRNIIKPAAQAAGFTCERADEVQHAGVIDVPMYERLLMADLVIADLSTANVNAFFELGVRYALRPKTTIVIAEKNFEMGFDMGHVVIRRYEHLGPGIDFDEVERVKEELTEVCRKIPQTERIDSPVYTFLADLVAPSRGFKTAATLVAAAERERDERTRAALAQATTQAEKAALEQPLAALMKTARDARARGDFRSMRDVLRGVRAVQGDKADPYIVQQLAFATYKSNDPDAKAALLESKAILSPLDPHASSDPETLGLWGAIHKRLYEMKELSGQDHAAALTAAIRAYQKGFYLKNDYYNGINFAFLLDCRSAELGGEDAIADRVQARRVRERVVGICTQLLGEGIRVESETKKSDEEYWVRATLVEALFGLGKAAESAAEFAVAKRAALEPWMINTTEEQLAKLRAL
jgi:Tetratricopeptide Repeats-Sensor